MSPIILESYALDGKKLEAKFLPDRGMNMISFKKGDIDVIDQSTWSLFEERYAGLGALIGPHFHRRNSLILPKIKDESLFPHIARVKAKGVQDPFSHGIARYAPWKTEILQNKLSAVLTGKDLWNNVSLAELEGQNFKMEYQVELKQNGLFIQLSIVSDTDSLVGLHYYYSLPNRSGKVISEVQSLMRDENRVLKPISKEWLDPENRLVFDLGQGSDFTFRPSPDPTQGSILLETESYSLKIHYECPCEENCWQLYHPAGGSFVAIEPISAQDPIHPNLTVSSLNVHLEII